MYRITFVFKVFEDSFLCISCYDEVKNFNFFKAKCQELYKARASSFETEAEERHAITNEEDDHRALENLEHSLEQTETPLVLMETIEPETKIEQTEIKLISVPNSKSLTPLSAKSVFSPQVKSSRRAKTSNLSKIKPFSSPSIEEPTYPLDDYLKPPTLEPTSPAEEKTSSPLIVKSIRRRRNNAKLANTKPPIILNFQPIESNAAGQGVPEEYIIEEFTVQSDDEVVQGIETFDEDVERLQLLNGKDDDQVAIEIMIDGVRHFKCPKCDKVCKQRGQLKSHQRTHTKEKPFTCQYCPKSFSENGNLKQHVRSIHLDMRPFVCEKCQRGFKTHYSHRVHVRSCVTGEKPYTCNDCGKNFISSGKLLLHRRKHTGERVSHYEFKSIFLFIRNLFLKTVSVSI